MDSICDKHQGMEKYPGKKVAIIVAHPDDETLWAGGTLMSHPSWSCFVACICRKNDPDRAPKFFKILEVLGANGAMDDLDDGPEQLPLSEEETQQSILRLLPSHSFDLIITHNPNGEYTRHRRHEEVSKAVIDLWAAEKIYTSQLWTFAYEDGQRTYYPKHVQGAALSYPLPDHVWKAKHDLMVNTYGFSEDSWEAQTTPKTEAFWQFYHPSNAQQWLKNGGTTK